MNISASVPLHFNSFAIRRAAPGRPEPFFQETESSGIGDISVRGRFGVSVRVKDRWPLPSLAYRLEGAPAKDVFGKSSGFRRPGSFGFIEPGVSYGIGRHLFSFNVAIRNYVNVKDATNSVRIEDATIPKYMYFAAYSRRF